MRYARILLILGVILPCVGMRGDDLPRVSFVRAPAFVSTDDLVDYQIRVIPHPER